MARRSWVVFASLVLLALPAGSTATSDPLSFIPDRHRARLVGATTTVERTRAALAGGTFVDRVTAVLALTGTIDQQRPSAADAMSALDGLSTAVRTAATELAVPPTDMRDALALAGRWAVDNLEAPGRDARSARPAPLSQLPQSVRESLRRLPAVAATVAAALDAYLPALAAQAATGQQVTGCDVIDRRPWLCVGSAGDNTYDTDAALLVDLGGNDTYHGSAGGAPFLAPDGSWLPVSVNVDLAGDDVYESANAAADGGFAGALRASEGGAGIAGLGVLVDAAGDDVYRAENPRTARSTLAAQGGSYIGFGQLFDLGGSDHYVMASHREGDYARTTQYLIGQGAASTHGYGLLVDEGLGSDTYEVDARSGTIECDYPCSYDRRGQRYVFAQGGAVSGTGVAFDDGGTDAFSVEGEVGWTPPTSPPPEPDAGIVAVYSPVVSFIAQGAVFLGTGLLIEGSGDTTYTTTAPTQGSSYTTLYAQGSALIGLAGLDDSAGDDTYVTTGRVDTTFDLVVDDGCRTAAGDRCPSADVSIRSFADGSHFLPYWPIIEVAAQGVAIGQASIGTLRDGGGSDRYEASSLYDTHAFLTDRLSAPQKAARLEVRPTPALFNLTAQGAASAIGGIGALVDLGGSNSYSATYANTMDVRAVSTNSSEPPIVIANPQRTYTAAQGASANGIGSLGALIDASTGPSRFEATSVVRATTDPDGGSFQRGIPWPSFHGSSFATSDGVFVALGQDAVVISHPSQPVCPGTGPRGYGVWAECIESVELLHVAGLGADEPSDDYGHGQGFAPRAHGVGPRLEITSAPQTAAGAERIAVQARLTDAAGQPIEGATVHFDVQSYCSIQCSEDDFALVRGWLTTWTADGVTDADGVASGVLPATGWVYDGAPGRAEFRVYATFDGAPGVWPAHDARAIAP